SASDVFGGKKELMLLWFKKISKGTIVWVANRETPITDTSGRLKVSQEGNLAILNGENNVIWSSNSTATTVSKDVMVQLLDSGNGDMEVDKYCSVDSLKAL
nr:putative S-locus glycoprotein domain-containing protein [Tanacetum cinerariifolium]